MAKHPERHESHESEESKHAYDPHLGEIAAQVAGLRLAMGQPGQTITQDQLDRLAHLDESVQALVGPTKPPEPYEPAPEPAPAPEA